MRITWKKLRKRFPATTSIYIIFNQAYMDPIKEFKTEREHRIDQQGESKSLKKATEQFLVESIKSQYSYNFSWMGLPVIQYPQDIVAMQEIIWDIKPDLIIETGV